MSFPEKSCSEKVSYIFSKKDPNFLETEIPKKNPYISRDGIFLYFRRQNFLILLETELSYNSGKVYSEP